jgi:hypothetical protein
MTGGAIRRSLPHFPQEENLRMPSKRFLATLAALSLGAFAVPFAVAGEEANCELAEKGTWTIIITPEGSGLACYGNPHNCCRSN